MLPRLDIESNKNLNNWRTNNGTATIRFMGTSARTCDAVWGASIDGNCCSNYWLVDC